MLLRPEGGYTPRFKVRRRRRWSHPLPIPALPRFWPTPSPSSPNPVPSALAAACPALFPVLPAPPQLDPRVIRLPVVPGSDPRAAYGDLHGRGVRGVVLEAFGARRAAGAIRPKQDPQPRDPHTGVIANRREESEPYGQRAWLVAGEGRGGCVAGCCASSRGSESASRDVLRAAMCRRGQPAGRGVLGLAALAARADGQGAAGAAAQHAPPPAPPRALPRLAGGASHAMQLRTPSNTYTSARRWVPRTCQRPPCRPRRIPRRRSACPASVPRGRCSRGCTARVSRTGCQLRGLDAGAGAGGGECAAMNPTPAGFPPHSPIIVALAQPPPAAMQSSDDERRASGARSSEEQQEEQQAQRVRGYVYCSGLFLALTCELYSSFPPSLSPTPPPPLPQARCWRASPWAWRAAPGAAGPGCRARGRA